jgi:hypothetical protein
MQIGNDDQLFSFSPYIIWTMQVLQGIQLFYSQKQKKSRLRDQALGTVGSPFFLSPLRNNLGHVPSKLFGRWNVPTTL